VKGRRQERRWEGKREGGKVRGEKVRRLEGEKVGSLEDKEKTKYQAFSRSCGLSEGIWCCNENFQVHETISYG